MMTCRPHLFLLLSAIGASLFASTAVGGARAADAGTITGLVDPAPPVNAVTAVTAVDRETDKKYVGKLDMSSGRFTIAGLPLGAAYDCQVDYGGARLEGVNLKAKASDYEEEQPLTKEDIENIKATARSLNQFEDVVDVMAVAGNIQHAAVLVNKLRTRPFINSQPGEVVWRLELWHFERPEETWIKEQDELFIVLYRERLQRSAFNKKALILDPALGGLRPTNEKRVIDVGLIRLPRNEPGIRLRSAKTPGGTIRGG
jgi:hypothetical protein